VNTRNESPSSDAGATGNAPATTYRTSLTAWSATALLVLAGIYTLYFARQLLLPITLAIVLSLLLMPLLRLLARIRVPRVAAALLIVATLVGAAGYGAARLGEPAAHWIRQGPTIGRQLEHALRPAKEAVQKLNKAAKEVEKLASVDSDSDQQVEVKGPQLRTMLLSNAPSLVAQGVAVVFLLFFLLAYGDALLRGALRALPSHRHRRWLLRTSSAAQNEVSRFLFTFAGINVALGIAVSAVMYVTGMPNPGLWGTLAGVLNFIPYLGALVTLAIISVASLVSFDSLAQILTPPLAFGVLTVLEGQMITPMVLGRRLALNPVFVFLTILFWGWLWGAAGALLAVPILVAFKIVCDHTERLTPVSRVLSRGHP
jgi:predicted PurR-regulated permease PerM